MFESFAVPYCPSEMCCNILSNSWLLMTLEPMPESMNAGDFVGFGPHKPPACSSFSFAKLLFSPSTVARHARSLRRSARHAVPACLG